MDSYNKEGKEKQRGWLKHCIGDLVITAFVGLFVQEFRPSVLLM